MSGRRRFFWSSIWRASVFPFCRDFVFLKVRSVLPRQSRVLSFETAALPDPPDPPIRSKENFFCVVGTRPWNPDNVWQFLFLPASGKLRAVFAACRFCEKINLFQLKFSSAGQARPFSNSGSKNRYLCKVLFQAPIRKTRTDAGQFSTGNRG